MRGYLCLFFLSVFAISCNNTGNSPDENNHPDKVEKRTSTSNPQFEIKTFTYDNGWGYDIYLDNQKYIHQPNIPAVNGLHIFVSEGDAVKVAELMVKKMEDGMTHPTISVEDLDSLHIEIR